MSNKMILYSYWRSSASYRVRIALGLKGIPYEYRAVHLLKGGGEQKAESYRALNPTETVPTLVDGDFVISESMAILDYLDNVGGGDRLFPTEPKLRAQVIRFCEVINSGIQPLQNLKILQWIEKRIPAEPGLKDEWTKHWVTKGLQQVEDLLQKSAGIYCFGSQVTAADALLVPQIFSSRRFGVNVDQFTRIMKIVENCEKLPGFAAAHPTRQPDAE